VPDVGLARALVAGLALAGCFAAGAQEPVYKTFDLAIEHGLVPVGQRVMRAGKGNHVRLRITSDMAGEVQLPGYVLEAKLVPGKTTNLSFVATTTGQHALYWQPELEAAGKPANPNAVPLATLEVKLR
jgi:hypothetical protein